MGTFIGRDSWLNRRNAAGLFGWGTTETGPQVTPTETSSIYDRHYFVGFPEGWVVKKKIGCGNDYGKLRLEVSTDTYYAPWDRTGLSVGPYASHIPDCTFESFGSFPGPMIYDPVMFSGGDGHVYQNFEGYINTIYPDQQFYYHLVATLNDSTETYGEDYQDGGLEEYNANTAEHKIFMGNWDVKMTPQDMIDYYGEYVYPGGYYPTNVTLDMYVRKPSDPSWDRKADVGTYRTGAIPSYTYNGYDYFSYDGYDVIANYYTGPTAFGVCFGMTFKWDEDWPAAGYIQKTTTKFRWKYDPQSTEGCKWWAGKVLSLKVTYKKAAVTRVPGPDGVFLTIGTWESGGNSTQSATLQDSYSEAYIADEVTMPIEDGYVYVIDDLEVVSVT